MEQVFSDEAYRLARIAAMYWEGSTLEEEPSNEDAVAWAFELVGLAQARLDKGAG